MLKSARACGMSGQVASWRTTWEWDGDGVSGRQCASACGVGGMGGCDVADWSRAAIVVTPAGGVACAAMRQSKWLLQQPSCAAARLTTPACRRPAAARAQCAGSSVAALKRITMVKNAWWEQEDQR